MTEIRAIETRYKGYKFRSRLEARWSLFLDAMGIEWEYEPEGYDLGEAGWYLPDFWLSNASLRSAPDGVWLEVKPEHSTQNGIKTALLGERLGQAAILASGMPSADPDKNGLFEVAPHWDCHMGWHKCTQCEHVKIEYEESNYYYCPRCGAALPATDLAVFGAIAAARSARFEHGEHGR